MDRLCDERRKLQDELSLLQTNFSSITDPSTRTLVLEQLESTQQKLDYVQQEIVNIQNTIVELTDEQVFF